MRERERAGGEGDRDRDREKEGREGQRERERERERERDRQTDTDRETSLLLTHHGFSVHPENHLFLRPTVEELKHPLRLLLFYSTPPVPIIGTAVSEHSNTHFYHIYLLCITIF